MMKKWIACCLCVLFLVGCTSTKEPLNVNKQNHFVIQNQVECELIKNYCSDEITPSHQKHYLNSLQVSHQAHQFIDVIVKTTNLTSSTQNITSLFSGHYEVNQQKYDLKIAIETADYNKIMTKGILDSSESRYVHLYCEVPKVEIKEGAVLYFTVLGERFQYSFTPETKEQHDSKKTLGDIIDYKDTQIVLDAMGTSKQIEPSHKGLVYSYIPAPDDNEIFLYVKCDIKNKTSQTIDLLSYLNCIYQTGQQRIPADFIKESHDHQSVSRSSVIEGLQTKTFYVVIPGTLDDFKQKGSIQCSVEGKTFVLEI